MDKGKISFIIGMICTMVGAYVINQGFGFIVTGIWAFIASFVESLKQDEQEEPKAPIPKKEIWHDVKLNTPGTDGEIVLLDSESKKFAVGDYRHKSNSIRFADYIEPYTWDDSAETFIYDKWCYVNDLIEK